MLLLQGRVQREIASLYCCLFRWTGAAVTVVFKGRPLVSHLSLCFCSQPQIDVSHSHLEMLKVGWPLNHCVLSRDERCVIIPIKRWLNTGVKSHIPKSKVHTQTQTCYLVGSLQTEEPGDDPPRDPKGGRRELSVRERRSIGKGFLECGLIAASPAERN